MTPPRALVVGQSFTYKPDGFAAGHNVEARDLEVARNLRICGWDASLLATWSGMSKDGGIKFVAHNDVGVLSDYAAAVLVDITGHRQAKQAGLLVENHNNTAIILDAAFWASETTHVRVAGLSSTRAVEAYRQACPTAETFLMPFGMVNVPADLPSPWASKGVKRVVYIGSVNYEFLPILNRIAECPSFELWIGALCHIGAKPPVLTVEESQRFCPNFHFLSDLIDGGKFFGGRGPVLNGSFWPALIHADAAFNISACMEQQQINGKFYDYLGAGCPTVSDLGPPNAGDVITLEAGELVPYRDAEAFVAALERVVNKTWDRERIRREAHALSSWSASVKMLSDRLRKRLERGAYSRGIAWRS